MHTSRTRRPLGSLCGIIGTLVALSALGACDQKAATSPGGPIAPAAPTGGPDARPGSDDAKGASEASQFIPAATTPKGPAENTYAVRGVIVALPGPNTAKQYLQVHHEAIPEFVGRSGAVTGMKEMIMDFPDLASGEVVRGIKVGDAVRFTFEVRWKSTPRTLVTKIEKLPEGEKPVLSEVVEGE